MLARLLQHKRFFYKRSGEVLYHNNNNNIIMIPQTLQIINHEWNQKSLSSTTTTTTRLFSSKNNNDDNEMTKDVTFIQKKYNNNNNDNMMKKKNKQQTKVKKKLYRADRVLSNRGWASRSECHSLLKQKRVFVEEENDEDYQSTLSLVGNHDNEIISNKKKNNNKGNKKKYLPRLSPTKKSIMIPISGPSERIDMNSMLWIDGKIPVPLPPPLLRVYHKPKWVLSVMGEDSLGRPTLQSLNPNHNSISQMHPVGRLDYDSSGLLLFSSKGTLTQALLHPSRSIEKEYVATVVGHITNINDFNATLASGVETTMGSFPAKLLSVNPLPDEDVAPFIKNIMDNLPPEYNVEKLEQDGHLFFLNATALSVIRLTVEEGKHRMVRRILANSGYPVIGLKRERIGNIELGDLKEGAFRELSSKELSWLETLPAKKIKPPKNNSGVKIKTL